MRGIHGHAPTPKPSLLVIDDEPDLLALVWHAVKRSECYDQVTTLTDSVQALASLQSAAAKREFLPSVILIDLNMPRLSGLGFLQGLRAVDRPSPIPVIVMTSYASDSDRALALEAGASAVVHKPSGLAPLTELLREIAKHGRCTSADESHDRQT